LLSSGQLSLSGQLPRGKTRRVGEVASNCCIFVVTGYFCLTIFLHNFLADFLFDVKSRCYDNVDEPNVRNVGVAKERLPAHNLSFVRGFVGDL
jgi:hypothetical protein